jgi:hypothetical protein
MVFVAFGPLVGAKLLDLSPSGAAVRVLAETTLALVLFSDASRIDLGALRRTLGVPVRIPHRRPDGPRGFLTSSAQALKNRDQGRLPLALRDGQQKRPAARRIEGAA